MRLLLLRHGQTPSNVGGVLDALYPGPGLTDLGRRQALAVPDALAGEPVDGLYVSRLIRTHETAAPLAAARGLTPGLVEGLQEISAGDYELRSDEEAVQAYVGAMTSWAAGDLDPALPGGESGHEFWARYTGALERIAGAHGADDTVAVVSHGAAIRVFACVAAGLQESPVSEWPLRNTGLVILEGDPVAGWELEAWQGDPIGGDQLRDSVSPDVTADPDADEAAWPVPATDR